MFKPISRRTFLRGASGALLPLPFLNAMETPATKRQTPLRFVALFKPNGVHPPSWNIEGGSEYQFALSPMMQPFARHQKDLLFIDNMGDSGFSSHMAAARRFMSGGNAKDLWGRASIDQMIADKIGASTKHRSLELTTEGLFTQNPACSYISYNSQGGPIPRESDPELIFDRLFRDPLASSALRREAKSLLDRVQDHAKSLTRDIGREDQRTLDQYLSVVRETEKRITLLDQAEVPAIAFDSLERPVVAKNLNEQVEVMLDLLTLALWTDSTRCATYMLGNDNSRMIFDFLGVKKEHHFLSHYFRNFNRANLEDLYKICLWHMQKFDYLLTRMKSYKDADGTLLDNSLVLFGAGMGESDAHTAQRIPTILAGKAGGRIKTGRYIRYANNTNLLHLHRTLLELYGVEIPFNRETAACEALAGLDGSRFDAYQEKTFQSRFELVGEQVKVQGRLRFSSDLNQANQFFIDVEGKAIRIQVPFKTFEQHNLPYFCGSPVSISGKGSQKNGEVLITSVTELQSIIGIKPK